MFGCVNAPNEEWGIKCTHMCQITSDPEPLRYQMDENHLGDGIRNLISAYIIDFKCLMNYCEDCCRNNDKGNDSNIYKQPLYIKYTARLAKLQGQIAVHLNKKIVKEFSEIIEGRLIEPVLDLKINVNLEASIVCLEFTTRISDQMHDIRTKEPKVRFCPKVEYKEYGPNDFVWLNQSELTNGSMYIGHNIHDPYADDRSSCDFLKDSKSDEFDHNIIVCPSDTFDFYSGDKSDAENQPSNIQGPKFIS